MDEYNEWQKNGNKMSAYIVHRDKQLFKLIVYFAELCSPLACKLKDQKELGCTSSLLAYNNKD